MTQEEVGISFIIVYLVTVVFNLTNIQFSYRLFASLSDFYEFLEEFKPSGNI